MNTKIDETLLARWLEDELAGAELAAFEKSALGDAELLAQREVVRALRRDVAALIPAVEEPAYPDFFNSRVEKAIRGLAAKPAAAASRSAWPWSHLWLPAGAAVGMALAFWLGTQSGARNELAVVPPPRPAVQVVVPEPGLYTPERGVDAEWFASEEAQATVILLEGLDAIPDSMDFSKTNTAGLPESRQGTADAGTGEPGGRIQ